MSAGKPTAEDVERAERAAAEWKGFHGPTYYRSKSGAMELELGFGPNDGVCFHFYPIEPRAKDWNGVYLDGATARRVADDLVAWLSQHNAADR